MNDINAAFEKSIRFSDFSNMFAEEFMQARESNNTIYFAGNGDSIFNATTLANDIFYH